MKKNIVFVILLSGFAGLAGGCTEAELPTYGVKEQAINFYTDARPNPVYPDDLKASYRFDFGSLSYFLSRGYKAFSDIHEVTIDAEAGVQVQGFTTDGGRKVFLAVDPAKSDAELGVTTQADGYTIEKGESAAKLPFEVNMGLIPLNETRKAVLVFDFDRTEFKRGLKERQAYTLECSNVAENTPRVPTSVDEFNLFMLFWDWGQGAYYGPASITKFKFMAIVIGTTDFSEANLPSFGAAATALAAKFKEALAEYRELNAGDPEIYPPLYQSGTTWISFP